ncbi:hypothetical protein GGR19_002270 [Croceicoccus naphthovorans]|uniref:hypothetical protein n=1 Tax=Croceicoccus naphthovorans TaxID=1348774 RepID=UPI00183A8FAC|nr:hypothetical protein [Croceicoccus naphthovorans]MBB3990841.1 hypothetical protein [Croceicoccus naphthovorans]
MLALAGCGGGDKIVSPGTGGDIIINNPTPAPTGGTPTPSPTASVTPAGSCPTLTGVTDDGLISGPTGTYRVCLLPNQINASMDLPYVPGLLYAIDGRVDIGSDGGAAPDNSDGLTDTNVTLGIDPGVIVFAKTGRSFLLVNRGNKINAVGTSTRPIVFTSRQNVIGTATASSEGQWGGVIVSGRAPVVDCAETLATPGTVDCQRQIEGEDQPALFGGATVDDNSGTMSYVQIRYSGFVLGEGSELQSLTTGGTGTGTKFDHIMSYNSSDDGMEFFGGYVGMKYVVVAGQGDDAIDIDTGAHAGLQHVIVVERPGVGNSMSEIDSSNGLVDATPRTDVRISNATFVGNSAFPDGAGLYVRGGADYWLTNSIVVSPQDECVLLRDNATVQTTGPDERGPVVFNSVAMQCGGDGAFSDARSLGDEGLAEFNKDSNNDASATDLLMATFFNTANANSYAAFNTANLETSFFFAFDDTDHIGAVKDATDNWYEGWTCSSSYIDLGNNVGSCASLPVY